MTALNHPALARAQSPRGMDRVLILAGQALVTWGRRRAAGRLARAVARVNRNRFLAEQSRAAEFDRWRSGAVRF